MLKITQKYHSTFSSNSPLFFDFQYWFFFCSSFSNWMIKLFFLLFFLKKLNFLFWFLISRISTFGTLRIYFCFCWKKRIEKIKRNIKKIFKVKTMTKTERKQHKRKEKKWWNWEWENKARTNIKHRDKAKILKRHYFVKEWKKGKNEKNKRRK